MKKYVIGNWKCNKGSDEAQSWFAEFARGYPSGGGASDHRCPVLYLSAVSVVICEIVSGYL